MKLMKSGQRGESEFELVHYASGNIFGNTAENT